ncbi:gephyrin-like molybdotransferase Glp [uncultured Microbacterium sp.]|uniref:Molybdopterin molybdenumtransferase n=1 Tax=uncultured Microbacterium sp. TaxID=191216 RepID=A0A1Y5P8S4_9MICO|nr:gephyrin-like molybdotransferase Glp [uncultured Microbacterium sp.]SBS75017.1 Molybdopterin molybdenumtransferase 2 [uncultured Microbacterium sp.]
MTGLRTVEAQRATVLAAVRPLPTEVLPLGAAAGRTLATAVRAAVDIPVFDNSAMDGFAVRAVDVAHASPDEPVTLRVVADLPAGTAADPAIGAAEAARIMTGSPMPTDADAIVPFEDTVGGLAGSLVTVTVVAAPRAGGHLRRRGEDARVGDVVLPAGVALGAWQLSAIAAAGVAQVDVARAPRVAVVSTGSELIEPGRALRRGQIPESNSILLASLAVAAGAVVVARESVDDDGDGLRTVLAAVTGGAEPADVVVFSGGVSAGAYEVVKNELAGTMSFSTVAMQPGKPQGFGVTPGGTLLFGLPGNPVSAAVSFEVFVRPALLALQGRTDVDRAVLRLPAAAPWRTPPARRQYLPVVIDRTDPSRWTVRPATAGGSGSHLAGGLGAAEALAVVPAETDAVAAGDLVDVLLLD